MKEIVRLGGRGLRYIRQYGLARLYRKVMERKRRNVAEAGYPDWLMSQLPTAEETERQRSVQFAYEPCISILVPAYETSEVFLRQMMDSVLNQSYSRLELCIADGSPSDKVERIVKEYEKKDSRVKYRHLTKNLGISDNTNAALAMASGEYVGLLDHDDLLLPGALFEILRKLKEEGGADAVYTDEDKVNMDLTRHFQPHFKPDYNQEYLRSNNYICHFFVVRRSIALEVGGFRGEFDGAQDHDFIFRCTEKADRVLHVPKVLYSWRSHEASTATNPESKLYAYEAGKRAVAAHLARTGRSGTPENTDNYGFYRVCYPGSPAILKNSLEKFHGQTGVNVVYYDMICNNSVINWGEDPYVLFVSGRNPEGCRVNVDFFRTLKACCDRAETGMACARVYDAKRRLASELRMRGVSDPFSDGRKGLKPGYTGYYHRAMLQQELEAPTACFLMRTEVLRVCMPQGKPLSMEALAERLTEAGYHIYYEPWAVMYEG